MKKNQQFQQASKAIDAIHDQISSALCSELAEISALKDVSKHSDQDCWHVLLFIVNIFSHQYCCTKDDHKYNPNKRLNSGPFGLLRDQFARKIKRQKSSLSHMDKNIKYTSLDIFDEDLVRLGYIQKEDYTYYRVFNLYLNIAFFIDLLNLFLELIPFSNPARSGLDAIVSHMQTSFENAIPELESELEKFLEFNTKDMSLFALLGRILSGRQVLLFNLVIKTTNIHLMQNINLQSAQSEFFAKHAKRLNRFNLAA